MEPNNQTNTARKAKAPYFVKALLLAGVLASALAVNMFANRADAVVYATPIVVEAQTNDNQAFENLHQLISEDFGQIIVNLALATAEHESWDTSLPIEAGDMVLNEGTTAWVFFVNSVEKTIVEREDANGHILVLQNSNDLSNLFLANNNLSRNISESTPDVTFAGIDLGEWIAGVGFSTTHDVLVLSE